MFKDIPNCKGYKINEYGQIIPETKFWINKQNRRLVLVVSPKEEPSSGLSGGRRILIFCYSSTIISSPSSRGRKRGHTFSDTVMTEAARRVPISTASLMLLP